jgi:hypothetical protein
MLWSFSKRPEWFGPNQSLVQWILGIKQAEPEAEYSLPSNATV